MNIYDENFYLHYGPSAAVGGLNGLLMCITTLSYRYFPMCAGATTIGSIYGLLYCS